MSASETTAGWMKWPGNPVLGGALGTCFDIAVLRDGEDLGFETAVVTTA